MSPLRQHLRAHLNWPPLPDDERVRFLALALCGEAGELAELTLDNATGIASRHVEMAKEVADVGNYTFMLSEMFGVTIERPTSLPSGGRTPYLYLPLSICSEAGKVANLIKKDWRGDAGMDGRRAEIAERITKLAGHTFALAAVLGVDLEVAMLEKMIEVEQRPSWKERAHG